MKAKVVVDFSFQDVLPILEAYVKQQYPQLTNGTVCAVIYEDDMDARTTGFQFIGDMPQNNLDLLVS